MMDFIDTFIEHLEIPIEFPDQHGEWEHLATSFVAEDYRQMTEEQVWDRLGGPAAVDFAQVLNEEFTSIQFGVLPLPIAMLGIRSNHMEGRGTNFRVTQRYDMVGKWSICPFHETSIDCREVKCLFKSKILQGSGVIFHIDALVKRGSR